MAVANLHRIRLVRVRQVFHPHILQAVEILWVQGCKGRVCVRSDEVHTLRAMGSRVMMLKSKAFYSAFVRHGMER